MSSCIHFVIEQTPTVTWEIKQPNVSRWLRDGMTELLSFNKQRSSINELNLEHYQWIDEETLQCWAIFNKQRNSLDRWFADGEDLAEDMYLEDNDMSATAFEDPSTSIKDPTTQQVEEKEVVTDTMMAPPLSAFD